MRRSSTFTDDSAEIDVCMRDAKSARCRYHDTQENDVPDLMQMLNTVSPVHTLTESRQQSCFEANSIFEISDTLNDDEPICHSQQMKNASGEESGASNQQAFVEELGLHFQAEDQEHLNGLSIVDMWDLLSLRLGEPASKYQRSTEPDRRLFAAFDGVLPPPKRYVPGRWKFFCKQMLLNPSID